MLFGCCFEEFVNVTDSSFSWSPIALLVLYLVLSSGFHAAAFLSHLSLGDVAVLVPISISFFVSLAPASDLCAFHLIHGFFSASFLCIQSLLLQSM